MNVDAILNAFNAAGVDYILIGGMNFLLRHLPELTFDVDLWVRDDEENLKRTNHALISLGAEWGVTEKDWKKVPADHSWLKRQGCFCLTTSAGALDIFRDVRGLEGEFAQCEARSVQGRTAGGVAYLVLSDEDMTRLNSLFLPPSARTRELEGFEAPSKALNAIKANEELKRERAYDPALRWKHIQETITWAEANMAPELRRNRPRVHKWLNAPKAS